MAMGSRTTFFCSLPSYEQTTWCPREGPLSRSTYEASWTGAGNPFPNGERDTRAVVTVDTLPRKRAGDNIDHTGAAGGRAASPEIRAFTIDEQSRRARSEPPRSQASRMTEVQTMQAFGVPAAIESGKYGRRQNIAVEPQSSRRQQVQRAAECGDIEGAQMRRHFPDNRALAEELSPQLARASLQMVDIDSHGTRSSFLKRAVSADVLPLSSPSFDLERRQSPRTRSRDFFDKSFAAEQYAKLLDRPNVQSDRKLKELKSAKARLALQSKLLHDAGLDTILDDTEIDDAESDSTALTEKSTTASQASTDSARLERKARRRPSEKKKSQDVVSRRKALGSGKDCSKPSGLQGAVASLAVSQEMLKLQAVQELMKSIESSADVIRKAGVAQSNDKPGVSGKPRGFTRK